MNNEIIIGNIGSGGGFWTKRWSLVDTTYWVSAGAVSVLIHDLPGRVEIRIANDQPEAHMLLQAIREGSPDDVIVDMINNIMFKNMTTEVFNEMLRNIVTENLRQGKRTAQYEMRTALGLE